MEDQERKDKEASWSPTMRTRSGRTVRLTEKATAMLAEKAEREFWKSVKEIERFGKVLRDLIPTCRDPKVFKDYLVTWMSLYNEVREAERDMLKFVPPERIRVIKPDNIRIQDECMKVKDEAYRHLQELSLDMHKELQPQASPEQVFVAPYTQMQGLVKPPDPNCTNELVNPKEIEQQIEDLQQTIQNLENEIVNLSTQAKIANEKSSRYHSPEETAGGKSGNVPFTSPIHQVQIPVRHTMSEPQGLPPTQHYPVTVTAVPMGNGQTTFNLQPTPEIDMHQPTNVNLVIPGHSTPVKQKRVRILAKKSPDKKSHLISPQRRSPRKLSRTSRGSPKRTSLLGDQSSAPSRIPEYMFREMQDSLSQGINFDLTAKEVQDDMMAWAALRAKYCTEPSKEHDPVFKDEVPRDIRPNPVLRNVVNSYIPSVHTPPSFYAKDEACVASGSQTFRKSGFVPGHSAQGGNEMNTYPRHDQLYRNTTVPQEMSVNAQHVNPPCPRHYNTMRDNNLQQQTYVDPGASELFSKHGQQENPYYASSVNVQQRVDERNFAPPPAIERKLDHSALTSSDQVNQYLAQALMKLTEHLEKTSMKQDKKDNDDAKVKLPALEPSIFQGDAFEFNIWVNSFVTLVESRISDPLRRLFYLSKYVSGPARKAIKELLDLNDDVTAYEKAMAKLRERYGSPMEVAESFKKKLRAWPNIKEGDHKGLMAYADFLSHCHTATKTVTFLTNLSDSDENAKLSAKLPIELSRKWNRRVVKRLHPDSDSEDQPSYPTFREFCNFVQREALIASGPCAQKGGKGDKKNVAALTTGTVNNGSKTSSSDSGGAVSKTFKNKGQKGAKTRQQDVKKDQRPKYTSSTSNVNPSEKTGKEVAESDMLCSFCNDKHVIEKCPGFLELAPTERRDFCRNNAICFGCLRGNHDFRNCKHRHNPLLTIVVNDNQTSVKGESDKDKVTLNTNNVRCELHGESSTIPTIAHTAISSPNTQHYSWVVPVNLSHVNKPRLQYTVYALIDTQSDGCFISSSLVHQLGVNGVPVELDIVTIKDKSTVDSQCIHGLSVQGVSCKKVINLPVCYEREEIPINRDSIARMEVVKSWPHLESVIPHLLPYDESIPIGLLLGYNCPKASFPHTTFKINNSIPWATLTDLGWSVMGPAVTPDRSPFVECEQPIHHDDHVHHDIFCHFTKMKETSVSKIREAFDLDFLGPDTDKKVSYEDTLFIRKMDAGFRITPEGHVELPLPVRESAEIPQGSRKMAYRRLMIQKRVLLSDKKLLDAYTVFFTKMFEQNQAEPAPALEIGDEFVWYLPHMVVYHPRKPDKPRVVFDGSATVDGVSLNDLLMSGPDMANNLVGVLLRFREDLIAFQCDIQGMFHQVMVTPKWRNMLRFFWFKDNDPNKPVVEYRVTVHLFGATSSPACATYALRKVAEKYIDEYGTDIVSFILRYFYVDDGLRSVAMEKHALDIILRSNELCSLGGFKLHEFCTNSKEVLQAIPVDLRAKILKEWTPDQELPNTVALGMHWAMQLDYFFFVIKMLDIPLTRRGLLSAVGSVYDPLGILAPVMLKGRLLLQELCHEKISWDQLISADMRDKWNEWYLGLRVLENLRISRCYKRNVMDVVSSELHMFSDACDDGYGACSYLVLEDESENRDVTLVMGKGRVKPLKKTTTPRLELQAAVLATRMAEFLKSELPEYPNMKIYLWTDSMIVLAYITNTGTRYRIYVANRVQTIRDKVSTGQWGHVNTDKNPADIASRGCLAADLVGNDLWFEGPSFLKKKIEKVEREYPLPDDDPEIHRECTALSTKITCKPTGLNILDCLNRHSEWSSMIRTVLVWRRLVRSMFKNAFDKKNRFLPERTAVEERYQAKLRIIQLLQKEEFPKEYSKIIPGYPDTVSKCRDRRKSVSSEARNLKKLDVFLCEQDYVLKVGGRIQRSEIPVEQIHPIILPHKTQITEKIIRYYHQASAHVGRYSLIHILRSMGYWITNIRSSVDYVLRQCVTCKKMRGKVLEQKMANLPSDRLEISPAFTYCGVDFFGPFYIKVRRSILKRWACLFTCLVVRAIHIEICESMTTDSFILAYRRFTARRGPIRSLRCDRGSNIIGARTELDIEWSKLSQEEITRILNEEDCDWITYIPNAPKASHMGGVWERMIGSVRRVLDVLLKSHGEQLCDEALRTLVAEAEAIVNNRPLTFVDLSNPEQPVAISPAMLLTLKLRRLLPPMPGKTVKQDLHINKMWKRVQYLSDVFWSKWKRDYLPYLNERVKWHKECPNLKRDDIVLLVDENQPRSCWPMGRIVDTKKSEDGLVRSITVKTKDGIYERPIRKIVFLYRKDT